MEKIIPSYYSKFDVKLNNTSVTLIDYFELSCGYTLGNVGKYLVRFKEKNGKEDLKKALTYLDSFNPKNFYRAPFTEPNLEQVYALKYMRDKLKAENHLLYLFDNVLTSLDFLENTQVTEKAITELKLAIISVIQHN